MNLASFARIGGGGVRYRDNKRHPQQFRNNRHLQYVHYILASRHSNALAGRNYIPRDGKQNSDEMIFGNIVMTSFHIIIYVNDRIPE